MKVLLIFSGLGKNHEISDMLTSFISDGFDQFSIETPLCNTSIVFFHIGQAHSKPFQLKFNLDQSVFQAQATVVY
jgi:hypothetical protein